MTSIVDRCCKQVVVLIFKLNRASRASRGGRPPVLGSQCYGLATACDNTQANANASSPYSLTLLSTSSIDNGGQSTSDNTKNLICLFPTWRRAVRERLKFLVRHREWDNMTAV